jgi:ribosome biogenesis GTPase
VSADCPRGCTHLPDAPDCALNEAVADGRLPAERVDSLQRLLATLKS